MPLRDVDQFDEKWPNLTRSGFRYTSPEAREYNCAAWAVHMTGPGYYWPAPYSYWFGDIPKDNSVEALVRGYALFGFERCDTPDHEFGFERIAIYARPDGTPQHVARQLDTGVWTSKMGELEDIEHDTLDAVAGPFYGYPVVYMKKKLI